MANSEEKVVGKIHADASKKQSVVDEIIAVHVEQKVYFLADIAAKLLRPDGKLTEDESEVFIREFIDTPGPLGKRCPKACEIAEEHHVSKDMKEWIVRKSAETGCTEGFVRAIKILDREPSIDELEQLRDNAHKR